MADLQQVIDVLNIHNNERRATEELQIGRDIDNNIIMRETNTLLNSQLEALNAVNESIIRLGAVLVGTADSMSKMNVALAKGNQLDKRGNSETDEGLESITKAQNKSGTFLGRLFNLEKKRERDAQLVRESRDTGTVKPKVIGDKKDSEDRNTPGGFIRKILGMISGLVLGGIAAVLGSELWLALKGITDGAVFEGIRDKIAMVGRGITTFVSLFANAGKMIAAVGAGFSLGISKVGKVFPIAGRALRMVAGGIKTFGSLLAKVGKVIPIAGKFLRVIPGLGQAITLITSVFSGIYAGIRTFMETGDIVEALKAGLSAAISTFINGFVDLAGFIFGMDPEQTAAIKTRVEEIVSATVGFVVDFLQGTYDIVKSLVGKTLDLFTESQIEADRAMAEAEEARVRQRMHNLARIRRDRRTEAEQAELESLQEALPEATRRAEIARLRGRMEDSGYDMSSDQYTMNELMSMTDEELAAAGLMEAYQTRQGNTAYRIKKRGELRVANQPTDVEAANDNAEAMRLAAAAAGLGGLGGGNVAISENNTNIQSNMSLNQQGGMSSTNDQIGPA